MTRPPIDEQADDATAERADAAELRGIVSADLARAANFYRLAGIQLPAIHQPPEHPAEHCPTHGQFTPRWNDGECPQCAIERDDARLAYEHSHHPYRQADR